MESLENKMSRFLEKQRGIPLLRDVCMDFVRAITRAEQEIVTELQMSTMDLEQRQARYRHLAKTHHEQRTQIELDLQRLEDELKQTIYEYVHKPAQDIPALVPKIMGDVNVTALDVSSEDALKALHGRLTKVARIHLEDYVLKLTHDISKAVAWYQTGARKKLQQSHQRIQIEFQDTLNLPEPEVYRNIELAISKLEIDTGIRVQMVGQFAMGGVIGFVWSHSWSIGVGLAVLDKRFWGVCSENISENERFNNYTFSSQRADTKSPEIER